MRTCYILLFTLLAFHSTTAQIKSGHITYKMQAPAEFNDFMDTTTVTKGNSESLNRYLKKMYNQIKRAAPYVRFDLAFNRKRALFKARKGMAVDNGVDMNRAIGFAGGRGLFFTNLTQQISIHKFKTYGGANLRIKRRTDSLNWKLREEFKTIQGYRCQKAIAAYPIELHRHIKLIAWFTTDLPFHLGPDGVSGLPGAILALNYNGFYLYADQIKLSKSDKEIKAPTKGKLLTLAEYNKIITGHDPRAKKYMEEYKKQSSN